MTTTPPTIRAVEVSLTVTVLGVVTSPNVPRHIREEKMAKTTTKEVRRLERAVTNTAGAEGALMRNPSPDAGGLALVRKEAPLGGGLGAAGGEGAWGDGLLQPLWGVVPPPESSPAPRTLATP